MWDQNTEKKTFKILIFKKSECLEGQKVKSDVAMSSHNTTYSSPLVEVNIKKTLRHGS